MRTNLWPQTDLMAAHLVRDEGVTGSNPATPTIQNQRLSGVGRPLKSVGHQFGHRNKNYASWPEFASWASNDFTIDDRESPVRQRRFSLRTRSRPCPSSSEWHALAAGRGSGGRRSDAATYGDAT